MNTEIEVKFVDINVDETREKLKSAGAELKQPMRNMKRAIIDYPDERLQQENSYIRVRDEGDRVTVTFKQFDSLSLDGAKELETTVGDFNAVVKIFIATGLEVRSYQETRRETWRLNGVEVVIDEWPWLNPYIEIEADSEEAVRSVAALLGYDWSNAVFGDVMVAYRQQYPHLTEDRTVGQIKSVKFGDPLPDMFVVK